MWSFHTSLHAWGYLLQDAASEQLSPSHLHNAKLECFFPARQCSLAVEHPLSKREVVGSIPAIGYIFSGGSRLRGEKVAERGFDPPTFELWAQHANHCATPLWCRFSFSISKHHQNKNCWFSMCFAWISFCLPMVLLLFSYGFSMFFHGLSH